MNPALSAEITIRRVGLNRIDDLLALEYDCFSCDRISRRNLRHLLLSPSACCLGAYHQGRLAGSMVVLFRSNSVVARIYSLAVAVSARGMGVGRRMMARAEREAKANGCLQLRLEVRMDNMAAIRLYEGLGFTDTRVIAGYYEDGTHAMVYRKGLE